MSSAVERRSSQRPWSKDAAGVKTASSNEFSKAAGSDVTDNWEEF